MKNNIFNSIIKVFFNFKKIFESNKLIYKTNLYECEIVKVENIIRTSNFKVGMFKKDSWNNLDKLLKIIEYLRNKPDRGQ
ncbi:MAG: hypothetical protein ACRC41_10125, partial [Sarcina sp.]